MKEGHVLGVPGPYMKVLDLLLSQQKAKVCSPVHTRAHQRGGLDSTDPCDRKLQTNLEENYAKCISTEFKKTQFTFKSSKLSNQNTTEALPRRHLQFID